MVSYFFLIPVSLGLGVAGLGVFLWSLGNGQYEDLDGAAERVLFEDDDAPPPPPAAPTADAAANAADGATDRRPSA